MPDASFPVLLRVFVAASLVAMPFAAGCAGSGGERGGRGLSYTEPAVMGAEAGLEVQVWLVEDDALGFAYALREHEDASDLPEATTHLWRANGLRIVPVPLDALDSLRAEFQRAGMNERRWHGLAGEWTPIVEGPRLGGGAALNLDSGTLSLGRGRLRLLGRCWLAPDMDAPFSSGDGSGSDMHEDGAEGRGSEAFVGAVMRIELLPQHAEHRRRSEFDAVLRTEEQAVERQGLLFRRLLAELPARSGEAFLLVPEDPRTDWGEMLDAEGDEEAGPQDIGPHDPGLPTLGEAMLSSRVYPDEAASRRMVVVLLPRVPERFELLGQ